MLGWMAGNTDAAVRTREPIFLESPADLVTEEAKTKLAESVGDAVVRLLQEERARRGLPPLPES
jgi:hypothetical protein